MYSLSDGNSHHPIALNPQTVGLCSAYLSMGSVEDAIDVYKRAVRYARESCDKKNQVYSEYIDYSHLCIGEKQIK